VPLSHIIINHRQIPFVRSVITVKASQTNFVSCLTENEDDTNELFDLLNVFSHTHGSIVFEIRNDEGKRLKFEGIISFIVKERYAVNFTAEPTGSVRIN
jgi:hypothetical protein